MVQRNFEYLSATCMIGVDHAVGPDYSAMYRPPVREHYVPPVYEAKIAEVLRLNMIGMRTLVALAVLLGILVIVLLK